MTHDNGIQSYAICQRTHLKHWKKAKNHTPGAPNKGEASAPPYVFGPTDLRKKTITGHKEGHYAMIQISTHQKDTMI